MEKVDGDGALASARGARTPPAAEPYSDPYNHSHAHSPNSLSHAYVDTQSRAFGHLYAGADTEHRPADGHSSTYSFSAAAHCHPGANCRSIR
jgi:hypothetical protein